MTKHIEMDDYINISFLITGDNGEEKMDAKIENPKGSIIEEKIKVSGGDFKIIARGPGNYELCFYVSKPGENFISFEYFTTQEKGHTLDMAKDGT